MATTREKLIDWLADLPDNTEIGIEDIYLVAMVGNRAQDFLVGDLSDESIDIDLATFSGQRRDMMERMVEIHKAGAGIGTTEGVMVVTFEGYAAFPNFSPTMRLRLSGSKTGNRQRTL
jgi:hypothetical protein